jgi:hypothetical protein
MDRQERGGELVASEETRSRSRRQRLRRILLPHLRGTRSEMKTVEAHLLCFLLGA